MAFQDLVEAVIRCGDLAETLQGGIDRDRKDDGSVITEADHRVNDLLIETLQRLYPGAGIISEESEASGKPAGEDHIFVIDPIDGTDAYSQGLPGWCIALAMLDTGYTPVGGIIYAPRWGSRGDRKTLLILEPGERATCNGEPLQSLPRENPEPKRSQIMVSSRTHRKLNLSAFPGKIRTVGSAILHLVSPLLYDGIIASVQTSCYIWDIAAAYAFLEKTGYRLEYLSGGTPDYFSLANRIQTGDFLLSGSKEGIGTLRSYIQPLKTTHGGHHEC